MITQQKGPDESQEKRLVIPFLLSLSFEVCKNTSYFFQGSLDTYDLQINGQRVHLTVLWLVVSTTRNKENGEGEKFILELLTLVLLKVRLHIS